MPIHDWTRVDAGLFHDFHQSWMVALRNALNGGGLPPDYFALVEQTVQSPFRDVREEADVYARQASRVTVRHRHGDVVAVIEIVSPGNKASRSEFRALVENSAGLIRQGVHLLVIDLFPPGPCDQGYRVILGNLAYPGKGGSGRTAAGKEPLVIPGGRRHGAPGRLAPRRDVCGPAGPAAQQEPQT